MNCPECNEPFIKHGGTSTTLVGFGQGSCGRDHDDNCLNRVYTCRNGHHTHLSVRRSCECGWKGKETCFCHPGRKLDKWPSLQASGEVDG